MKFGESVDYIPKKSRFNFGNDLEHILDIVEIIILSHHQP